MKLTPLQIAWFRLRRSGLVDPFGSPEEVAGVLVGVQAQLPPAANLAFWNRTDGLTPERLEEALLGARPSDGVVVRRGEGKERTRGRIRCATGRVRDAVLVDASRAAADVHDRDGLPGRRTLVRFWGQRNTVHIFRSKDWPLLHAAFAERRSILERRLEEAGLLPTFRDLVRRTRARLARGARLTHRDVRSKALEQGQDRWRVSYVTFMQLVREGVACHGGMEGTESTFVHREHWLPDLRWEPPPAESAQAELARRYLAAYGPAGVADLAHWSGTSTSNARRWIESLGDEAIPARVGAEDLWCLAEDRTELATKPPPRSRWPSRLLHHFDPLLLGTKDKSWLVDAEHYKQVWRPSAQVAPVILAGGRIAGTWRYDRKAKGLVVTLRPFRRLSRSVIRALEREAEGIAGFQGVGLLDLQVERPLDPTPVRGRRERGSDRPR